MNKDRNEYIIKRINEIRGQITKLRNDLNMTSVVEYNVGEDLWCADHRLCDSIKYIMQEVED